MISALCGGCTLLRSHQARRILRLSLLVLSTSRSESFGIVAKVKVDPPRTKLAMSGAKAQTDSTASCIQNFRQASGLPRIYRCASTDPLADILEEYGSFDAAPLLDAERTILHEVGLILDLRSASERDDERAQLWTRNAPLTPFLIREVQPETHVLESSRNRQILQIDALSPRSFVAYAGENWLTPLQKTMAGVYGIFDAGKVHEMVIDTLNERGLAGLNEIILETGDTHFCVALQEITLHLEEQSSSVAIHCVQGKDRTGMLVMLCQSILGLSDDEIVDDYHKSDVMRGSSAWERTMTSPQKGRLDRNVFSGSPREAMVYAVDFIRSKYGSVSPDYVDSIGFDESWRERFRVASQESISLKSKL